MGTRTHTETYDDLDDSSAATETISFSVNETTYQIDLNEEHAADFMAQIGVWISNARVVAHKATRPKVARSSSGVDKDAIRAWANDHGFHVAPRGRIAEAVVEAYTAAHAEQPKPTRRRARAAG